jgi:hypothetical protein
VQPFFVPLALRCGLDSLEYAAAKKVATRRNRCEIRGVVCPYCGAHAPPGETRCPNCMAEIRGRTIKVHGLNAQGVRDVAKALHAQVSRTTENTRSSAVYAACSGYGSRSEEYCYGFRVGLDWKPLTRRDQYSSCAPRLNIPNRDHHLLRPPYVHSISARRRTAEKCTPDSSNLVRRIPETRKCLTIGLRDVTTLLISYIRCLAAWRILQNTPLFLRNAPIFPPVYVVCTESFPGCRLNRLISARSQGV